METPKAAARAAAFGLFAFTLFLYNPQRPPL